LLNNLAGNQRAALERILVHDLPHKLAGLDPVDSRALMATTMDGICALFQENTRKWLEEPPA